MLLNFPLHSPSTPPQAKSLNSFVNGIIDPVEAIALIDMALKDVDESDTAPEGNDNQRALVAKEVDTEGGRADPESKSKAEAILDISEDENDTHVKGKANEINILYSNMANVKVKRFGN